MIRNVVLIGLLILVGTGCSSFQNKPIDKSASVIKSDSLNVNRPSIGKIRYFMVGRIKSVEIGLEGMSVGAPFSVNVFKMSDDLLETQIQLRVIDTAYFEINYISGATKVISKLHFDWAHESKEIGFIVQKGKDFGNKKFLEEVSVICYAFSVHKGPVNK